MSGDNRLNARLRERLAEPIQDLAESRNVSRAQIEREVVETGLAEMGHLEKPTEPHERLLWYVRRVGLGLGFVGLVLVGVGVFGPRVASLVGFGLTLGGLCLLLVEALLDEHGDAIRRLT